MSTFSLMNTPGNGDQFITCEHITLYFCTFAISVFCTLAFVVLSSIIMIRARTSTLHYPVIGNVNKVKKVEAFKNQKVK